MTGSGFDSEWSWRLEPVAGGTRVIHAATFEPFDRWTGILVRLGRASLASRVEAHLRVLKERAEAARRSASHDDVTVDPARIGPPPVTPDVPFEGLRRHARALVGGLVLVILIGFVLPDLAPPPTQPPPVELLRGRIVELLPASGDATAPDVRIEVLDGDLKGQTVDGLLQGPSGGEDLPRYQVGDEVSSTPRRNPTPRSSPWPTCTASRPSRSCSRCSPSR